jgi:hypothetical protein
MIGRGGDPILAWSFGANDRLAKAVHPLPKRPPFHRNCRCGTRVVQVGEDLWEVSVPMPTACPECVMIAARRRAEIREARDRLLKDWLADNGHPDIIVEEVPEDLDFGTFTRAYSHLKRLMEECPTGVPKDGLRLSFRKMGRNEFAEWVEGEHRLNLSPRYFGSERGLRALNRRLTLLERRGRSPASCNSPEYVITHEYGHCLRHRLNGPRYGRWWIEADKVGLGRRGADNYSEGFAEAFSATRHTRAGQWPDAARSLEAMLREDGVL